MKHLKMSMMLLLTVAIFTSCEKETTILSEDPVMNIQETKIIDYSSYKSLHDMNIAGIDMERYFKSLPEVGGKKNKQSTSHTYEYTGVEFFYEGEEGFNFPCNNMPTQDFSEARKYSYYAGNPLNKDTDNDTFSPGDILPGISFESPGGLYMNYFSGNFLYNYPEYEYSAGFYYNTDLIINFTDTNVTSVRMKIAQWYMSFGGYSNVDIAIYGLSDNLLGTSGVNITPYGENWGVITLEPIKKIVLSGLFPGVYNVSFGSCDDLDNDGVLNENDLCDDTPSGEEVDSNGCSQSQLDDDNDGVMNTDDDCSKTPRGEAVDGNGCGQSQLDDDGDGVMNSKDAHIYSILGGEINIGGFYPNVNNVLVRNGSTMMDQIGDLINEINAEYNGSNYEYLHRKFIMLLERKVTDWRRNRLVTNSQRDAVLRSAASASIPYFDQP